MVFIRELPPHGTATPHTSRPPSVLSGFTSFAIPKSTFPSIPSRPMSSITETMRSAHITPIPTPPPPSRPPPTTTSIPTPTPTPNPTPTPSSRPVALSSLHPTRAAQLRLGWPGGAITTRTPSRRSTASSSSSSSAPTATGSNATPLANGSGRSSTSTKTRRTRRASVPAMSGPLPTTASRASTRRASVADADDKGNEVLTSEPAPLPANPGEWAAKLAEDERRAFPGCSETLADKLRAAEAIAEREWQSVVQQRERDRLAAQERQTEERKWERLAAEERHHAEVERERTRNREREREMQRGREIAMEQRERERETEQFLQRVQFENERESERQRNLELEREREREVHLRSTIEREREEWWNAAFRLLLDDFMVEQEMCLRRDLALALRGYLSPWVVERDMNTFIHRFRQFQSDTVHAASLARRVNYPPAPDLENEALWWRATGAILNDYTEKGVVLEFFMRRGEGVLSHALPRALSGAVAEQSIGANMGVFINDFREMVKAMVLFWGASRYGVRL